MATVKYRVREFTPTENQTGTHSFYAQAVVDNIITNQELARKIEARGISRAAEIKAILEEAANIIMEEVAENNRVQLEGGRGVLVSLYPKAVGNISDKEVADNAEKYQGKTVAEAEMLTADRIKWSVGASVGINFSRQFGLNKTAQKVDYNPSQTAAEPAEDNTPATPTNPGSSGNGNGGNE